MVQSTNQVSLYRKMDKDMADKAGLKVEIPQFSYRSSEGITEIEVGKLFDGVLKVNEFDTEWAPSENDLSIKQKFIFNNPSALFGEDGVTMNKNKIGLAVHLHSKTSGFQQKLNFGSIVDSTEKIEIDFEYNFPKNSLRGNLEIDFFLFLQESNETKPYHAKKVGMTLSEEDLYNLFIVIDGNGSAFPITEFSDKDGPLWILEKNWIDASEDTFDSSNVNLSLNIVHPLFEQVKNGKLKVSKALMGDIMVQAMSMIIQQVVIIEGNSLEDLEDTSSNSILAVVKYWVSTFEVDTTSIFTIMNSLRRTLEKDMIGGE
ncbi:hypothetical protein ACH0B5_00505 [Ureibacillus sp. 179-F W5.1 NHS]|uniref:hypothetical protein n=1 Tax=Ureibacillus sp. 179-F W5.1 NHS TaxID=3374297 RepID=UPI0038792979